MDVRRCVQEWGIDKGLAENLEKEGINSFFPVQNDVIPVLLRQNSSYCIKPQDICVSAPTGSGKTLSYALPIVNTLLREPSRRLRAIILLPSRELAKQVHGVMATLMKGTHLRVAIATGQRDFETEQHLLLGPHARNPPTGSNLEAAFSNKHLYNCDHSTGESDVDVLVCTAGRLLDHLQFTRGFSLAHLRFLVLDEADRMLGNAYHSWVRLLVQSALSTTLTLNLDDEEEEDLDRPYKRLRGHSAEELSEYSVQNHGLQGALSLKAPLQRLLFSATLTDNPSKLAMLGIYSPLLVRSSSYVAMTGAPAPASAPALDLAPAAQPSSVVDSAPEDPQDAAKAKTIDEAARTGFTLPEGLSESRIVCESEQRPVTLVAILLEARDARKGEEDENKNRHRGSCCETSSMCIIFTSSVEETHRLCLLLQLMNGQVGTGEKGIFGGLVEEMSRTVRESDRARVMQAAKEGAVSVLVSSDHMARGIDLPNVRLVINYDPPKHVKTYVHRAGRTARALRIGHCVSILNVGQLGAFRKLRGEVDGKTLTPDEFKALVGKCSIRESTQEGIMEVYKASIKQLPKLLRS
jgi:ATP-dependent RNA helicase DDX51/DBP6